VPVEQLDVASDAVRGSRCVGRRVPVEQVQNRCQVYAGAGDERPGAESAEGGAPLVVGLLLLQLAGAIGQRCTGNLGRIGCIETVIAQENALAAGSCQLARASLSPARRRLLVAPMSAQL
jgi:hypothetical protein